MLTASCDLCTCAEPGPTWETPSPETKWQLFHSACLSCLEAEARYSTQLCDFCRHLRLRHFRRCLSHTFTTGIELNVGTLSERNADCQLCQLLCNAIERHLDALHMFSKSEKQRIESYPIRLSKLKYTGLEADNLSEEDDDGKTVLKWLIRNENRTF